MYKICTTFSSPLYFIAFRHFSLGSLFFFRLLFVAAFFLFIIFFYLYADWHFMVWRGLIVCICAEEAGERTPRMKNRAPFSVAFHNFEKPSDTFSKLPPQAMQCNVRTTVGGAKFHNSLHRHIQKHTGKMPQLNSNQAQFMGYIALVYYTTIVDVESNGSNAFRFVCCFFYSCVLAIELPTLLPATHISESSANARLRTATNMYAWSEYKNATVDDGAIVEVENKRRPYWARTQEHRDDSILASSFLHVHTILHIIFFSFFVP